MADEIIDFYKKATEPEETVEPIVEQKEIPAPIPTVPSEPFDRFLFELADKLKNEKKITEQEQQQFNKRVTQPTTNPEDPFARFLESFAGIVKEDKNINREENIKNATINFINNLKNNDDFFDREQAEVVEEPKEVKQEKKKNYLPPKFAKKIQKTEKPVVEQSAETVEEPTEQEPPKSENAYVQELKTADKSKLSKVEKKISGLTDIKKIIAEQVNEYLQKHTNLGFSGGGGGTVAVQYADGGTMRGDLNVTGKYLSGGQDLATIFAGGGGGPATPGDRLISGPEQFILDPDGKLHPLDGELLTLQSESSALSAFTKIILSPYGFFAYDGNSNSVTFDSITDDIIITSKDLYEWTFNSEGYLVGPTGTLAVSGNLTINGNISGNNLRTSFNLGSATGDYSFAENLGRAFGDYSHAEGYQTIASGNYSHAEGSTNTASGDASHAEGNNTIASGYTSHAEGQFTIASGDYSHAEGSNTYAASDYSHTEGANNITGEQVGFDTFITDGVNSIFTFTPSVTSKFNGVVAGTKLIGYVDLDPPSSLAAFTVLARSTTTGNITANNNFGNPTGTGMVYGEGWVIAKNALYSHAAGYRASAVQDYTYAWSDGNLGTATANVFTTRAGQYMVSASGGMFIPGKVGIGIDSYSTDLSSNTLIVNGDTYINNNLTVNGNISATNTIYASGGIVNTFYAGPMARSLSLSTPISAISGVYIDPLSGYTGIQTFNPIAPLDVRGTMNFVTSVTSVSTVSNIKIQGSCAYVTNYGSSTLQVYDLAQSAMTTTSVASASTSTQPQGLYVSGNYAYIVTYNSSSSVLQIFDITTATAPTLLSTTNIGAGSGQNGFNIVVQGNYTYISTYPAFGTNGYIVAFDISNPYVPLKVFSVQPSNSPSPSNLTVQGKYLYWLSSALGTVRLYRMDVSNPRKTPTAEVVYSTPGGSDRGLAIRGKYAYFIVNNTLYVVNITTGIQVGISATLYSQVGGGATSINSIILQGYYAYILYINGFLKVDISNISLPKVVQTVNYGGGGSGFPSNFAIQGRYAYLPDRGGSNNNKINIIDLGGAYIQQLDAGGIETDSLDVIKNTTVGSDLDVVGGAAFGQGFKAYKDSSVQGSLYVTSLTSMSASTYFSVASSSGSTLFTIASTGNVGVNIFNPNKTLTVNGEISANSTIYEVTGNSNQWNTAYTSVQSNSASWFEPVRKFDYTTVLNVDYSYSGTAPYGTADDTSIWKLIRLTYANNGSISNSASAINSWTGRLTATYV